jgi:hypothetical protein
MLEPRHVVRIRDAESHRASIATRPLGLSTRSDVRHPVGERLDRDDAGALEPPQGAEPGLDARPAGTAAVPFGCAPPSGWSTMSLIGAGVLDGRFRLPDGTQAVSICSRVQQPYKSDARGKPLHTEYAALMIRWTNRDGAKQPSGIGNPRWFRG